MSLQAYCRSTCYPYEYPSTNAGKLMRYWFSYKEWGNIPEMDVRCTDRQLSQEGHLNFQEMFKKMRSAIFCPVFPGDAASTRRLSEIFLAGCIPVFLGPPYHSMPFSETVCHSFSFSSQSLCFLSAKHRRRSCLLQPFMHTNRRPLICAMP